ncbi:hypothetical protein MDOR_01480 [Mycolicibacterium doricum]|uniref:Secreted protein n=1 Tax=Mycolicibacterium doricum TaxID=126673 RepID=A0A1X1TEH2_9MYCO|nr:hypothetical protein [Mycolicibacterium doricum]MCV7267740.1 hypothetical protein [Mycolicibacterium doricum]ORV42931.1 hypothetical protein AWC01_07010 [Mycolicibacterium doricum]BBZ05979.1 hypothetical protein MDOR_01480 [Mycolicibacterium doricum]
MKRRTLATLALSAAVLGLPATAAAHAAPPTPQPGADCPPAVEGALSHTADDTVVQCTASRWEVQGGPYPSSNRWFSGGDGLDLHGQGMRHPEMMSGPWTGIPQDPAARCRAEQAAVVSAGKVGQPQVAEGEPGQPLRFEVLPVMFTIHLSGNCLWQAG